MADQVMGSCNFSNGSDPKVVWWSNASNAPMMLDNVEGNARSVGIDMNYNGQIAGNFLITVNGKGFTLPFFWDSNTSNAEVIGALPGGSRAVVVGIANNGTVVGNSEVDTGDIHPFLWTSSGGINDLGTLLGGNNSFVTHISLGGGVVAGCSEVGGETNGSWGISISFGSVGPTSTTEMTVRQEMLQGTSGMISTGGTMNEIPLELQTANAVGEKKEAEEKTSDGSQPAAINESKDTLGTGQYIPRPQQSESAAEEYNSE